MMIWIAFILVAVASADLTENRQASLKVLDQLRAAIPDYQNAQDSAIVRISDAKQNTSTTLSNFYHSVFEIKTTSLVNILEEEVETISYGARVDDWCWESNIPMLEGIMSWVGNDFSECTRQLDDSIADVIASIYKRFQGDEQEIKKFGLLEVFLRRNIINNPQAIVEAINQLKFDLGSFIPELEKVIVQFEHDLVAKLPGYSGCLTSRVNQRKRQIDQLKDETERCLKEQKMHN
ncbi:uncharacterized protein LOC129779986 [Toxorhynchites rutilus septentrionalis]|uniref:uncharacterized protein LOC129779986 n=1 Tax=Toxorhynchites rutilus septentrionalis TaxID=329112 RepID=UPI00247A983F|nr:uncharacterized protein LOC129779986 [Toxorhynchites rutilus septentrionalis]